MPSKQEKFIEFDTFKNCFTLFFENISKGFLLKGSWHSDYFKNSNPIVLELGCGKGEYTIGLSENNHSKNYIGVDIKGNRIWVGAKYAIENNLNNVAFLRTRIDFIEHCFLENEIDEIWITFPDPQPQISRERKRLTSVRFLNYYQNILKPNGIVHLKTDSDALYDFTHSLVQDKPIQVLAATTDLYNDEMLDELLQIQTTYEKKYLAVGKNINYLKFSFE
jgi:tRNA (guanine-N7-)-methyltransferase